MSKTFTPLKVGELVKFRIDMVETPVRVGKILNIYVRNSIYDSNVYDYIVETNLEHIKTWFVLNDEILAVKRDKKWVTYETQ